VVVASPALERARQAFELRSWGEAYTGLSLAGRESDLDPADEERLATSAYLTGRDAEADDAWMRAHQRYAERADWRRAARCAIWPATCLIFRGDFSPAVDWIARATRALDNAGQDCAEHGWLLTLTGLPMLFGGDPDAADHRFMAALEIAERFGDNDLSVFTILCHAFVLISQQRTAETTALLDEVRLSVLAEKISPIMIGIAYCTAIDMCQQMFDLRHAREWTANLTRWCDSQPDLVPYRGNCLVHRCEIFHLQGAWTDALDAATRACEWLSGPTQWDSLGSAYYQLGEVQRVKGEFADAEAAYLKASRAGRDPEPGMSLLRLARGESRPAATAIRRALDEAESLLARSKILPAFVEVMIANNELEAAQDGAAELQQTADTIGAPYLRAIAAQASGAVLLASKDARTALRQLRKALAAWRDLDAPYPAARVRELMALACRSMDDHASAQLEFDAARVGFEQLGARPDLTRITGLMDLRSRPGAGRLTARELEVLALVASGKSNRVIAADLVLSEKTVARHVSNILTKLDLESRSQVTAYAYRHGLV
jgi:DNA-binding NarL/FixJ family response regulator